MATYSRVHLLIEGRVQGVGFRYFTVESANALELKGWVRNTYQGHVEVMAEGEDPHLDQFISRLWRGPGGSKVVHINVEKLEPTNEFQRFSVVSTY